MKTKLLFLLSSFLCLTVFAQTQIGNDINGSLSGEFFGQSIALSSDGTRIVIGAPYNNEIAQSSGKVKVFDYNGSEWMQTGNDINGTGIYEAIGIATAISADGSRIAVGGYMYNSNTGYVSIYDWNGSSWIQVGNNITGEATSDYSGYSIDLSANNGNRIAIGAYGNSGNGTSSGHVRIFEWNGANWIQVGIDIDGENAGDESGIAVALSSDGNRVAIGAHKNDGTANYAGHVRVYDWNSSSWNQVGTDLDGEAGNDRFGIAVDLSSDGNRVAIGGWYNDGNGADSGHVRVFDWNGSNWIQTGIDIDGENGNDGSGMSVALNDNGNRIAIGAWGNDGGGSSSGHVRVYDWNGSSWVRNIEDIDGETSNDNFGTSVALSSDGQTLASGAIHSDGDLADSGDVRVFDLTFEPNLVAYYPFNGYTNDESGFGNNGVPNGATLTTDKDGNPNSAYSFDGIDDYIRIPHNSSLDITGNEITISMWLYNDNPDTGNTWKGISKGGYDVGNGYELLFTNFPTSNGKTSLNIGGGGYFTSSFNTYSNQWIMLTGTFNNGVGKVYINGLEQSHTTQGSISLVSSASDLYIGARNPANNYEGFLKGKIDDIRIYNSALTEQEVLNLYNFDTLSTSEYTMLPEEILYIFGNTIYFYESLNLATIKNVSIYNLLAQNVFNTRTINREIPLYLLDQGIYILKVEHANGMLTTKKFLIN